MTRPVNPPPQLQIPRMFRGDREAVAFFDQQRTILRQLYDRTGGATDSIADLDSSGTGVFDSYAQQAVKIAEGLPEFTIDTTGFTFDTTKITFDKVIA